MDRPGARRDELEDFKRIDLPAYAAALGYQHDRRESWAGGFVLRRVADNDKVVATRDSDGHWIYASVRDQGDNGTIVDFVQRRLNLNLGQVRRELRPWLGRPATAPAPYPAPRKAEHDRAAVLALLGAARPAPRHPYLERKRAIPPSLLSSSRFLGSVLIDARGNAVFPHRDRQGWCGAELKNTGYTGAPKGGKKGLWLSACRRGDTTLLIAEAGIDALSYAALHPDPDDRTRYAATSGALNPTQPGLIVGAIERLEPPRLLLLATDRNNDGERMAEAWADLAKTDGPAGLRIERVAPPAPAEDWNDALRDRADRDR